MNPKHIIKSLPLLASVLGRKYGVQVRIGGDNAFTNGNVIQLPSLPLDCDETLLGLVRGLIDHESAQTSITETRKLGLEVYGIGIANASILSLLPDTSSVINSIAELAPSMFGMLQRALIAGHPAA